MSYQIGRSQIGEKIMTAYDITFNSPNGGEIMMPVKADTLELAVAKATAGAMLQVDLMGTEFGAGWGVASTSLAMGLATGTIMMTVKKVDA